MIRILSSFILQMSSTFNPFFLFLLLFNVFTVHNVFAEDKIENKDIFDVQPYSTIRINNDYELRKNIKIPKGCTIIFNGGAIYGKYRLTGDESSVIAPSMQVFSDDVVIDGGWHIDNYDVKWMGAKGNGRNDDTKPIQKTIDWAQKNAGNVYFPSGEFLISSSLKVNNNLELSGCGQHRSIIKTNNKITMLNAIMGTSNGKYVNIKELCFDGNNKACMGILLHKVQGNSIIERVTVKNIVGIGVNYEGWCWTGSIVRSEIWNCSETGLRLGPGSNDYTIDDVNFYICGVGVELNAGDSKLSPRTLAIGGVRIKNSVFESISESSIVLTTTTASITAISICNNYFEQIRRVLVTKDLSKKAQRIRNVLFSGNTCYLGKYGNNDKEAFIDCSKAYIQNMAVTYNSFLDDPKSVLKLGKSCYDIHIYGNMIAYSTVKNYVGGIGSQIHIVN